MAKDIERTIRLVASMAALWLAAACTTGGDVRPTISSAVTATDEATTDGQSDRLLNSWEKRRLLDAAREAFVAPIGVTTSHTVAPRTVDAAPTVVSATASGPPSTRADGRTCRLMTLALVREGKTTTRDLIVCREPGSDDLKPA